MPASEAIPEMAHRKLILHSGPPIRWENMNTCSDGSKNRRAQRTALIGSHNLQRTVQHVAAGLHEKEQSVAG